MSQENNKMIVPCDRHSNTISGLHYITYKCEKRAAYRVTFRSGVNGQYHTENVCKMHFNALNKNVQRIKKLTKFDSNLTFTEISQTTPQ